MYSFRGQDLAVAAELHHGGIADHTVADHKDFGQVVGSEQQLHLLRSLVGREEVKHHVNAGLLLNPCHPLVGVIILDLGVLHYANANGHGGGNDGEGAFGRDNVLIRAVVIHRLGDRSGRCVRGLRLRRCARGLRLCRCTRGLRLCRCARVGAAGKQHGQHADQHAY